MSDSTVNPQITDAVTQTNVKVVGEAPAISMGSIYQSIAYSTGILFQNAVTAQQQQNIAALAATNQGIIQIYSVDTMAAAGATAQLIVLVTGDHPLAPSSRHRLDGVDVVGIGRGARRVSRSAAPSKASGASPACKARRSSPWASTTPSPRSTANQRATPV